MADSRNTDTTSTRGRPRGAAGGGANGRRGGGGRGGGGGGGASRARRGLRREIPGTLGVIADPGDFAAMRGYRSFAFTDHEDYLAQADALLRSLALRGIHTTVVLFDPEEYADHCAERGTDPDTSAARTRFTADLAGTAASLPYGEEPLSALLPRLVDEAVRQATWEYATVLLSGIGSCADCGEDIGQASFDRAALILRRLLERAGPGHHHLVCSVPTQDEQLVAVLHADTTGDPAAPPGAGGRERFDFVTVLATGLALGGPGGLVLRTTTGDLRDRVHGWRLDRGRLVTLSAAAVFNAYCTDADTGEPVPPEPGVEYCPGYEVDEAGPPH
ncbi:hypothetical protein ABZY31_17595 [Streptomyces sp. NPDC006529]|uniref:hypothetical protein n=1 Tax=Streptomyces sp. NPDC006529 TaxID=3157177 RepID=UPI0033A7D3EB